MTTRQLRLVRGAAASAVATVIAAVSHTIGGGSAPHPLLVVSLGVLLVAPCTLLVGRTSRLPSIAAAVTVAQGVFHLLFDLLDASVAPTAAGGHHHHGVIDPSLLTAPAGSASAGSAGASTDPAMLLAHVVAAVLTTLLLWRGESALRSIAGWVLALLRARVAPVRGVWRRPRHGFTRADAAAPGIRIVDVPRRGPPFAPAH